MQKTLEKLTALGSPWHGLVEGGQLSLPNGQSMAYPQPWYNEWSDAGRTLYQKMPWAPGANRTPEQAVADAAAGMQWRDDVLISGAGLQLYGQQVNGWIYAGPDGKPWHIDASLFERASIGTSFSGTLRVALFGRVNVEPEVYEVPLSLASTGQNTPTLSVAPRGEVMDITPDGSQAIIMLWAPTARPVGNLPALDKMSVGFLQLTLTGTPGIDFVASLSVLRTREQTLGSVTDTGQIPEETVRYYTGLDVSQTSETVNVNEATCTGYREVTITPQAYPTAGGNVGESFTIGVAQGQRMRSLNDRIAAMWFVDGVPSEVTLTLEETWSIDAPPLTQSVSGQDVIRRDHAGGSNGACTFGPSQNLSWYTRNLSRSITRSRSVRMSLSHAGQSVSWQASSAYTGDYQYLRGNGGTVSETYSQTQTVSTPHGSDPGYDDTASFSWWAGLIESPPEGYTSDYRLRLAESPFVATQDLQRNYRFGWQRYSNNLIALYQRNFVPGEELHYGPASYPGGQHPGTTQHSGFRRYGSYNPATGAVTRNQLNPVCWI